MNFLENMNSKKFIFAVLAVILSFVLVLVGKLPAAQWIPFVGVIGTTYVIVNVTESRNSK